MGKLRNKHLKALNLEENSSPSPDKIWKAYSGLYMEYKLDKHTNKETIEKKLKKIAAAKDFLDEPQDEQDRLENEDEVEKEFNDGFEPAGKRDNNLADRFFKNAFKIREELLNDYKDAESACTESLKRQEELKREIERNEQEQEQETEREEDQDVRDFRAFQKRYQPELERKEEEIIQRQKDNRLEFSEFLQRHQQEKKTEEANQRPKEEKASQRRRDNFHEVHKFLQRHQQEEKTEEASQRPREEEVFRKPDLLELRKRYQQELIREKVDPRFEAEKRKTEKRHRKAKFLQLAKSHFSPILSAVLGFTAVSLFTYFCQATLLTSFGLGFFASLGVYYITEYNKRRLEVSLKKYADPSKIAEINDKMTISALKAGTKANTLSGYLPSFWNYTTYRRKDAFDTGLIISKANDQTALKEVNKLKI